jgi:uncharacterized protein YegP (UPF0339 family)
MRKSYWSIRRSKDDQFYFCFIAKNGQVIVTSEMYTQKHNAIDGCKLVISASKSYSVTLKDESTENAKTENFIAQELNL